MAVSHGSVLSETVVEVVARSRECRYEEGPVAAVDRLQASGDLEISLLETRRLIDVYNEENDENKLNALYPAFTALSDSMNRLHRDIVYATAHVRAAITNERQENNALKKQLDEHRRNHAPIWIVVALTALAAIVAGIFVCRRIRRRREPGSHYYVTDEHEVRDVSGDRYPSTDSIEMHSVSAGPEVAGHNIKIDKDSGAPVALVGGALSRGMSVSCYDNICAAWSLTLISLGVMMRSITPVSEIIKVVR